MSLNILQQLQENFESLYRLDPAPKVTEFVLEQNSQRREQLLILEEDDLYLGLVLDPAVPLHLQDPALRPENLQEFCLAVEGVSHFLFVIFCARQERRVTALEIELQGEVDKYVASLILANRSPSLPAQHLRSRLYDHFHLLSDLDPMEQRRYWKANTLARSYTHTLEQRFISKQRFSAMMTELRQFYRMCYQCKQELIALQTL